MLLVLVAAAALASSLPVASLLAVALPKPLPQQEHADKPEHLRELQVGDDDTAADDDDTSNGPMDGSYGFCTICPSVVNNIWGDDESGGGSDRAKCDAFLVCGNLEASDTCEATPGALRLGRRTHSHLLPDKKIASYQRM